MTCTRGTIGLDQEEHASRSTSTSTSTSSRCCNVAPYLEHKEDEDSGEGDANLEASGQHVVVPGPPALVVVEQVVLEDKADDKPGGEVDGAGGRGDA